MVINMKVIIDNCVALNHLLCQIVDDFMLYILNKSARSNNIIDVSGNFLESNAVFIFKQQ